MNRYVQYMYSYPHKTAYRPLHNVNLSDYMEHATDQHNLSYRSFDTDQGRMYNLILCRNKDTRLTIEGTTNFLGLELVEAIMLETPDVEVSKGAEEKQLALF